jgi:hypothetical protein
MPGARAEAVPFAQRALALLSSLTCNTKLHLNGPGGVMIEIDLRTRVFAPNEQIHILFPGEGYRHFPFFERNSLVFLDFPGIELPEARPRSPGSLKSEIARAAKIRDWHSANDKSRPEPSRDLADYQNTRQTARRTQYATALIKFCYDLPNGSVIVVPGPGPFGTVRVAELSGPLRWVKVPGYGDDLVPARSVRWISAVPKRRFSEDLINRLRLPIPLFIVERSLEIEIIKSAYDNFAYGGEFVATFDTTNPTFDSVDDFNIQGFVNLIAGALVALEEGEAKNGFDLDDALKVLTRHTSKIPEINTNINSPGFVRYITQDIAALVIASVMALALSSSPLSASEFKIVNSAAGPDDPCAYVVNEKVKQAFEIMDIPSLQKACERARDTSKKTGLKTTVRVTPKGKEERQTDGKRT